jgi:hypothetical protein
LPRTAFNTARRFFLTCFGALARARCAALPALRRAFLTGLGASSHHRTPSAHLNIATAHPTITVAHLALPAGSSLCRSETSHQPPGKRRRAPGPPASGKRERPALPGSARRRRICVSRPPWRCRRRCPARSAALSSPRPCR